MLHPPYLLFIDDAPIAPELIDYFSKFDINIQQLKSFDLSKLEKEMPQAILLHSSLIKNKPGAIPQLYNSYPIPLLILADSANEELCIQMLELGADDFVCKPLYPRELHARISAIRRRVERSQHQFILIKDIFVFGNWKLVPSARRLFNLNNQELHLSSGEYELLLIFVQKAHQVLDREYLLHLTKNSELSPFDRRIDVQISRLRQKIEIDPKNPLLIKTIRNGGYMFTPKVILLQEKE